MYVGRVYCRDARSAESCAGASVGTGGISLLRSIVEAAREIEVGWIATALVLVLASVKFSMRLVGARA